MKDHVAWVIELALKEGKLGEFEELMNEMVEGTSAEPQTLAYEWYISGDSKEVHIFEKYADSDAMILHVNGFIEKWSRRFMDCVDITRFVVYGDPSTEARKILDGWGAKYLGPWGGFSRLGGTPDS